MLRHSTDIFWIFSVNQRQEVTKLKMEQCQSREMQDSSQTSNFAGLDWHTSFVCKFLEQHLPLCARQIQRIWVSWQTHSVNGTLSVLSIHTLEHAAGCGSTEQLPLKLWDHTQWPKPRTSTPATWGPDQSSATRRARHSSRSVPS